MVLAICFLNVAEDDKGSVLPPTILLRAIEVRLDSLSNWFALEPASVVLAAIRPSFDTDAFGLAVGPLTCVDLPIRELTLAA